jgi:predicted MPP superfamily phosphohydrolase
VFTGDFVSLNKSITAELDSLEEMLLELDLLDIPVFFVWGNRDLLLFEALRKELEKKGIISP